MRQVLNVFFENKEHNIGPLIKTTRATGSKIVEEDMTVLRSDVLRFLVTGTDSDKVPMSWNRAGSRYDAH